MTTTLPILPLARPMLTEAERLAALHRDDRATTRRGLRAVGETDIDTPAGRGRVAALVHAAARLPRFSPRVANAATLPLDGKDRKARALLVTEALAVAFASHHTPEWAPDWSWSLDAHALAAAIRAARADIAEDDARQSAPRAACAPRSRPIAA